MKLCLKIKSKKRFNPIFWILFNLLFINLIKIKTIILKKKTSFTFVVEWKQNENLNEQ